ncbi:membrane-associated PAP2 superfamily phosphatase [Roseiarcus fermentans]|uniref:Membrane-associated PAP2 superfamily phosphatase n=1 Tax=Roseiarcus fermentans TaxID=1473586 RepID=A0A366FKD6_9HYPH|nr:phosphatase PAP2 family protein [Roseiarcus fermentans]RBP14440.1 membrane-associated PAP2 superfamily phosphatase [Roseiarcus fermentans]
MKPFFVYVGLAALTLVVFALRPDLDLAVSHVFYDHGGFLGRAAPEQLARKILGDAWAVVLLLYAALWLMKRLGRWRGWAPTGRAMIFLLATIAIGPGLVVNLSLKDHWHRPRPVNTQDFNGTAEFKPWYESDGACRKNCSFVSGEASTGFWMVAPAMALPPPARGPAIVAAFVFGVATSLLRLAFGGHYLSDVLLGGLVTLIVIELARMLIWPRGRNPAGPEPAAPRGGGTAAELVGAALAARKAEGT